MSKNKILKSIAAAGIAFGGASVLQDAEIVYAAELENEEMLVTKEVVLDVELPSDSPAENETLESPLSEETDGNLESETENQSTGAETSENASMSESTSTDTSESASESTSVETTESESTS